MEEVEYISYVGNAPGKDNVVNYHKKDLTRNIRITADSNAVFGGPFTVSSTMVIESGATVIIV
tara:strand:- start:650 stop:838 length:189 start_codon:yes stop_codon:yes gene_type:complete